ncbi:hypothetical protein PV367_32155, partial [Streptomyces europaeiscabiei]|nr:hypothetical protein [Streptomyces europaeiscabiei]
PHTRPSPRTTLGPEVVYVPVSGGTAAGGAADPDADTKSDTDGTSGGTSGAAGTVEKGTTTKNTGSQSTADALWADGSVDSDSNDYWDQSTVTVKSTKPLGSLKVVVRVMQTGGVSSTGVWTSLGDDATVGENSTSDQLGYVITLKPGVTLAPRHLCLQGPVQPQAGPAGREARPVLRHRRDHRRGRRRPLGPFLSARPAGVLTRPSPAAAAPRTRRAPGSGPP